MRIAACMIAGFLAVAGIARADDGVSRLGVGANYWVAIDNIDVQNVDDNGFSYYASFQYWPGPLGFELNYEIFPDRFGADASAPAAYLLLGQTIYLAAGVGIVERDGKWADNPFYAIKAGLDLELFPGVYLDIGANYRVDSKTDMGDAVDAIDTDTLYLGAAIRFGI